MLQEVRDEIELQALKGLMQPLDHAESDDASAGSSDPSSSLTT